MTLSNRLKELAVIWTSITGILAGSWHVYSEYSEIINYYALELFFIVFVIAFESALWFVLSKKIAKVDGHLKDKLSKAETDLGYGLWSLQVAMLKQDVDRFFNQHKNSDSLSEDDAKYLYMLQDKLKYYKVNSFSQRKVEYLLEKEIT